MRSRATTTDSTKRTTSRQFARAWSATLVIGASACCPAVSTQGPKAVSGAREQNMSAKQILAAAVNKYNGLASYRDTGKLVDVLYQDNGSIVQRARFGTIFVRDQGLRFDFQPLQGYGNMRAFQIVSTFEHTLELRADHRSEQSSLSDVLRTKSGVTAGTSLEITALLLPNLANASTISRIGECARRAEDRTIEGDTCYQLRCADDTRGSLSTVLISKATLLLRRLETRQDYSRQPKYDGPLTDYANNPLPLPHWKSRVHTISLDGRGDESIDAAEVELPEEAASRE